MKHILFCGGGTVGHISPALAIAEELKKKEKYIKISFIGRKRGTENEIIKKNGYSLYETDIRGLSRSLSLKNVKTFYSAITSEKECERIIKSLGINLAIGTGGYVCWPVLSAAHKLGVPTALHESNASLGLTTKLLLKKCDVLFLGADINVKHKNSFYTGNPIRRDFLNLTKSEARKRLGIPSGKKFIFSVGGSIGAKKLNDACVGLMREYSLKQNDIYHIHCCGSRYYDEIKKLYPELCDTSERCRIVPFAYNIADLLTASDMAISRCGAMTLSEIAYTRTPSILVPSPNVTGNHQLKNALFFEKNNASLVIEERALSKELLKDKIDVAFNTHGLLEKMSIGADKLRVSDASKKIADIAWEYIKNENFAV